MNITQELFGKLTCGENVSLFTLTNTQGTQIKITNFGGIITAISTEDAHGGFDDIVLGYDSLTPYLENPCYFGAITGRFTGRIKHGVISVDNEPYQLICNNDDSQLHGGSKALHKKLWKTQTNTTADSVSLTLTHTSPDGDEGFPGELNIKAIYTLTKDNTFTVEYYAETNKATLVNMSQHSYFNLSGHKGLNALSNELPINDHLLTLSSDLYFPMSDDGYPTGKLESVKNTPFDFTEPKCITAEINESFAFDHYLLLNTSKSKTLKNSTLKNTKHAATVINSNSGRSMGIYTSQPSLVFYTGNFLDGSQIGKKRTPYEKHAGFCLEPVNCVNKDTTPNNKSTFIPSVITPTTPFHSITHYVFDTVANN